MAALEGNGVASFKPFPVDVTICGGTYRIPTLPAALWVPPIVEDNWIGIVPGLIESDSNIDDEIESGKIKYADCVKAARDAISVSAGVVWWSAVRLVRCAVGSTEIMGELVLCGVDVNVVSLGAFVCATYRILVRDLDKKQRAKIDSDIKAPVEGLSIAERAAAQPGSSGFEAMMAQRGGRV